MPTTKVLHKLLTPALPSIHSVRLDTLMAAVNSLVCGAKASVTSLGRGLAGNAYGKHKIKRMDRSPSVKPAPLPGTFFDLFSHHGNYC